MKKSWLIPNVVIISATPIIGLASCNQHIVYPYESILSSYKQMLVETINTTQYGDKDITWLKSQVTLYSTQYGDAYYFKDIDYEDEDRAIWPAHQHIVRALEIAIVGDQNQDEDKIDFAIKLLNHWIANNYVNSNWWFNEIGVPRDLSNMALFLFDKLTMLQQDELMKWIHHGSFKYAPATRDYTGTNTFWAGDITMKSAALVKDTNEMDMMFYYVYKEIQVDKEEGFQSDGSYFQHGKLLYSGGYGRQGALILAKIASAFNNTDFRLKKDKLSIIVNFVLDGLKYMTHKGNFTWQCMGRTYTRKDATAYHPGVTDLGDIREFKYIANLPNCPRKQELQWLVDNWSKDIADQESNFQGIKYFPHSQFISWSNGDTYIGIKGTTPDLINGEMGNGENELGHNLAFGFNNCVIKKNGDSYSNISPVWDYSSIPGTTSPIEDDETLSLYDNDQDMRRQKEGPSYGGYSNQHNIAYVAQQASQRYRKKPDGEYIGAINYIITSFACDDGIVVLATGINNTTGLEIHTTVDQYITSSGDQEGDAKSFTCDGIVYSNIEEGDNHLLHLDIEHRNKSWYRNNHSYSQDDTIEKNVTTITLNNPSYSSYAYAITSTPTTIKVAKNTSDVQAIFIPSSNKLACMFWETTSFQYEGTTYSGNAGEFNIFPVG